LRVFFPSKQPYSIFGDISKVKKVGTVFKAKGCPVWTASSFLPAINFFAASVNGFLLKLPHQSPIQRFLFIPNFNNRL